MALFRCSSGSGGGGGGAPELIWENPSPTSDFAASTINESSSGWVSGKNYADYDGFIIALKYNKGDSPATGRALTYVTNDVSGINESGFTSNYFPLAIASKSSSFVRNDLNGRKVSFSSGIVISAETVGGNSYAVPIYIWGVKGKLEA